MRSVERIHLDQGTVKFTDAELYADCNPHAAFMVDVGLLG